MSLSLSTALSSPSSSSSSLSPDEVEVVLDVVEQLISFPMASLNVCLSLSLSFSHYLSHYVFTRTCLKNNYIAARFIMVSLCFLSLHIHHPPSSLLFPYLAMILAVTIKVRHLNINNLFIYHTQCSNYILGIFTESFKFMNHLSSIPSQRSS